MNKYRLYKLLSAQGDLKDQRHPMFEKNRFMKLLAWFMFLYYAGILLFLGVVMGMGMGEPGLAAFHVFNGIFPWILLVDFWLRFVLQETPAQQVQPFRLLPIRRSFLMNMYLIRSGLSLGNLFWGFLLVPFGAIAILPLMGWTSYIMWLLAWWMMIVINGYCYLFCRALCMRHLLWTLFPAVIHGALVALMVLPDKNPLDTPCTLMLYQVIKGNLLPILALAGLIALTFCANFHLQMGMIYNEVAKKEDVELKSTTQMNFLNRYGAMGEYLKMEVKLRMRNKQVRMQFLVGLGLMLMLSGIHYFTDAYSGEFMTSFICFYNYVVLGMMTLVTIMCFEGNYIDGLMARRESIYDLLRAKYYFNTAILLIPICIATPLMVAGKLSVWMNLGYLLFTAGVMYPGMFQLAVYNNNTIPLNQKLTGKQATTYQNIASMLMMFLPIALERAAVALLGDPWGYILLCVVGLIGIATHHLWLRNIYHRFMQRRYINMEGFRASRK